MRSLFLYLILVSATAALAAIDRGGYQSAPTTDTARVSLTWDPNQERDVVGYRVHWGTVPGQYTSHLDVGNATAAKVRGLAIGSLYFLAVTAYNDNDLESEPSNEVAYAVPEPNPEPIPIPTTPPIW